MKEVIGKYAFEIIVIFIGITSSFLFEEWRQNQEKDEKAIEIMQAMIIELERNHEYILEIDTSYQELDSAILSFIIGNGIQNSVNKDSMNEMALADLSYILMDEIPKYRLKNISSFIHGFSSADQLHIINSNRNILTYLSYLESLLVEHENNTNQVSEYASSNLWPLIYDYGLANYLVADSEKEFFALEKNSKRVIRKNIKYMDEDHELIKHLQWSQLKVRRLMEINKFIHKQIKNTIRELNIAIEEG